MKNLHFKDYFWNADLTSSSGYDAIIQYLNDGKRTCKEVEEFMKARATIEEKYAKDLQSLSKKVCGHNEMKGDMMVPVALDSNAREEKETISTPSQSRVHVSTQEEDEDAIHTLKKSLDMFKLQMEHVSLSHLQLAQSMREEAKKLEEFREKQKEMRKKIEQQMDALHKQRSSQFKKTFDTKKTYEQKCREKEEADQNVNRNANTNNTKHIEKLYTKAQQAKQNAEEADRFYQQSVNTLAKVREEWLKEHMKACEMFEIQAKERINFLRNTVWTHLNQLSQQCVTSDELYEEVRKSLELCDVQKDVEHFINLRQTGDKPPAPVLYENFYSGQRTATPTPPSRTAPSFMRRAALPDPTNSSRNDTVYSTVQDAGYSVIEF